MICPKCDGKGYVYNALGSFNEDCGHCQGTGKVRAIGEPMTNEEWFCGLPTEEKAEFLVMIQMSVMHPVKRGAVDMDTFIEDVADWLKQPHKE